MQSKNASKTTGKKKRIVKLSEAPQFKNNPFVVELKGRMYLQPRANTIVAKGQEIVDTTTGEVIQDSVLMGRRKIVDKSQFAKLYASEIGILFELSKPAINVFMHLTKVMDYDQRAYFNYFKEYSDIGYKNYATCYKGIIELLANDIIALDVREHTYWLNPTIVCKGERFAVYTEYVTEGWHNKDLEARRIAESRLREQGSDKYDSLDDQTQYKLEMMNRKQESEHYRSGFQSLEEDQTNR